MPSRSLSVCHPVLQERFAALRADYQRRFPDRTLKITCSYRSPEEQAELYEQGRSRPGAIVTYVASGGSHSTVPCRALDVCVLLTGDQVHVVKPEVSWDVALYRPILSLAEKHGLVSGGSWLKLQDWPHLELPREVE